MVENEAEQQQMKEIQKQQEEQRRHEQQQQINKGNQNISYSGTYKYRTTFIGNIAFDVPLRTEATVNSQEKYKCPKDAVVFVIDDSDNIFSKVYVNGYVGYVSKGLLVRTQ